MAKSRRAKRPVKKAQRKLKARKRPEPPPLKLDLGCGSRKTPGYIGVDKRVEEGVDQVVDLRKTPWPWKTESVDDVVCRHMAEHLEQPERVRFFNELWRVLKFGAKALIVTPDWSHSSAYGDPTHRWPPMSGWYVLYLNRAWRAAQAPHTEHEAGEEEPGYSCDFDWVIGMSWDQWLTVRPQETKEFAMQHYTNSAMELIVTLTKVKREEAPR